MTLYRRAERRAGLRRRHDPVGVGPRRQPRPRLGRGRHRGAAGDGQPVRRHGRAADDPAARPGRGHRLDRHDRPDLDDHLASRRRARSPLGTPVTITRHRDRHRRRRVGGVEVSTDGGATWHRATGRESWTYTFTPSASGTVTIRSRATDDSANIETPCGRRDHHGRRRRTADVPVHASGRARRRRRGTDPDTSPVEVGVKFRTAPDGLITGIRFYKPAENTGTHVGTPVDQHRHPARPRPPSPARPPAAGSRPASPRPSRSPPTRPTSRPTSHPRGTPSTRRVLREPRPPSAAADRAPERHRRRQRRLPLRPHAGTFPTSTYNSENYWVDVVFAESDRHHQADRDHPDAGRRGHRRRGRHDRHRASSASPCSRPPSPSSCATPAAPSSRPPRLRRRHPHRHAHPDAALAADHDLHGHRQRRQGHRRQHHGPGHLDLHDRDPGHHQADRDQPHPGGRRHRRARRRTTATAVFSEAVQQATIALRAAQTRATAGAGDDDLRRATRTVTLTPTPTWPRARRTPATLSGARTPRATRWTR